MINKEVIRLPLTGSDIKYLDQIQQLYKTPRATLLQIYTLKGLREFELNCMNGIFVQFQNASEMEFLEAVIIRIDGKEYQKIKSYAVKMGMTIPKFVRFLAIPKLQEEHSKEVV